MNELQVIQGLVSFLGIAVIIGFLYGPWQHLVVDLIRQQIFELRDSAFDEARRGEYAFDSRQHIIFRDFANVVIRNASHVTVWNLVIGMLFRNKTRGAASDMVEYLSGSQSIAPLKTKFNKVCKWVTLLLWLRSPALMLLTIALAFIAPIVALAAIISSRVRRLPRLFEAAVKSQIERNAALDIS